MTRLFSLVIFLAMIVIAFLSLKPDSEHATDIIQGLPWQIEVLPDGDSNVFGVTLGQSSLADARQQLGDDMTLAIIVAAGQDSGGLEMFYSRYTAGVFSGQLILAADLEPATLARLTERAIKSEYMKSGARKFTLDPADLPVAFRSPLASMTFIPTANIDEDSAVKRFGPATETIRPGEQVTQLRYPDKGLVLIINENGKEVLQYVAPRDFERLIK